MGLKEAKELIDRQRATVSPAKAPQVDRHRAPGEVPRVPGIVWLVAIVAAAVLALVAHRLLASPG